MGDPASIRFWKDQDDEHPLSLYLYWGGAAYADDLANALAATQERWKDEDYATRMAIQSILEARHIGSGDLSAGLYVGTADHGEVHPVLNVNWGSQIVWSDDWRMSFAHYLGDEGIRDEVQA